MTIGPCGGVFLVEGEGIGAFGKLNPNVVVRAFAGVVLEKFGAEATGLDAHHGIDGRVEIRGAAELLCSNLVFLDWGAGVFDGVVSEIAQKLTEGLGTVKNGAGSDPLNLA